MTQIETYEQAIQVLKERRDYLSVSAICKKCDISNHYISLILNDKKVTSKYGKEYSVHLTRKQEKALIKFLNKTLKIVI